MGGGGVFISVGGCGIILTFTFTHHIEIVSSLASLFLYKNSNL